jgi:hypothetical protein
MLQSALCARVAPVWRRFRRLCMVSRKRRHKYKDVPPKSSSESVCGTFWRCTLYKCHALPRRDRCFCFSALRQRALGCVNVDELACRRGHRSMLNKRTSLWPHRGAHFWTNTKLAHCCATADVGSNEHLAESRTLEASKFEHVAGAAPLPPAPPPLVPPAAAVALETPPPLSDSDNQI